MQAIRHAERQRLVGRNVAALAPTPAGPRDQGRSLTVRQALDLLRDPQGHPLEAAIVVGLTCGLRPGELLGLAWEDVDLHVHVLRVRGAVVRDGKVKLGSTKTRTSRRELRLPSIAAEALVLHRAR